MNRQSKWSFALTLAFGALWLCACQAKAQAVDTSKEAMMLRQAEQAWSQEMSLKDPARFAAHYAADALVATTGAPAMHGPKEAGMVIGAMMKDPAFNLTFAPDQVTVARSGELAYSRGAYKLTSTDPKTGKPMTVDGVYVTVYTKGPDGRWLASADLAIDLPTP